MVARGLKLYNFYWQKKKMWKKIYAQRTYNVAQLGFIVKKTREREGL